MKLYGYNLPSAFSQVVAKFTRPPRVGSVEARPVADALAHPRMPFYNPDELSFPDKSKPTVPGNGGYITQGVGMVVYDHQAQWDRSATVEAGPVREFVRAMMEDRRIKQT